MVTAESPSYQGFFIRLRIVNEHEARVIGSRWMCEKFIQWLEFSTMRVISMQRGFFLISCHFLSYCGNVVVKGLI